MKRNFVFSRYAVLALLILIITSGCSVPFLSPMGESKTDNHTVDLGLATSARVQIVMDTGELTIDSGSGKLMEGTFNYTAANGRPEVSYRVDGIEGVLLVSHPDENSVLFEREGQNRWDLRFNENVPIALEIFTGAGNSKLNLSTIDLTHFKIETGMGNGTFDLSGIRSHDVSAKIKGGLGDIMVILPQKMGVRVNVNGGNGGVEMPGFRKEGNAYINDAFGKSAGTFELEIQSYMGAVELQLR